MTELPLGLMAPKVMMDRHVHERLLRLRPSSAMLFKDGTFFVIMFLEMICMALVEQVKELNGRYEVVQLVRVIVVAYIFRFMQSRFGHNKVPLVYYLRKVLLIHDLPITALISAFYTVIRIFPKPSDDKLLAVSILLPPFMLVYFPKGMELLEQYFGPTLASSLNTELVHQQSYDAANSSISSTSNLSQWETQVNKGVQVTDHFIIILLGGLCVDLTLQLERLVGSYNPLAFAIVLATMHVSRYLQLTQGKNKLPTVYYQQKTVLFYDIPITAAIAGLYIIFGIFSTSLVLLLCLEFFVLATMPNREKFNQTKGVELVEQDINPTQASSNTESVHQQSHDAGFTSDHDASNRMEDAANANSISDANNPSRWIRMDRIGSGGFGAVYVAENRETKAISAAKLLKDNHIPEHVESIQKEIEFLKQLEHSNIVKYFDHEIVGRDIYLYMEYIQPGSLRKYISEQGVLHEPLIRNFTAQILSGLVYLHSERVVHRDIKPDNILVDPNNVVKLADFGLAKHIKDSVGNHSKLGTYPYAAPEVLRKGVYNSSPEAYAADIWSLGCVIIEMFTGQIPWPDSKMEDARIEELCRDGKDFLELCFKKNPDERASAKELLGHPFVIGTN